jgi:hypothetical protein
MAKPKLKLRTVFVHDLLTEWARQEPEVADEAALIRQYYYGGLVTAMKVTIAEGVNADGLTRAEVKEVAALKKKLRAKAAKA